MSDSSEKRERRQFEPPPWERDAFEELARKRAEEAPESPPAPPQPLVTAQEIAVPSGGAAPEKAASETAVAEPAEPKIPPAQIDAMLMNLAAEEPDPFRDWTIGAWVAAVLGLFGAGIAIYGLVGMTRGTALASAENRVGILMMGVLMTGAGAILLGMATWVGLRAWKRRGE